MGRGADRHLFGNYRQLGGTVTELLSRVSTAKGASWVAWFHVEEPFEPGLSSVVTDAEFSVLVGVGVFDAVELFAEQGEYVGVLEQCVGEHVPVGPPRL